MSLEWTVSTLLEQVKTSALALSHGQKPAYLVSVSGGVDSISLLHIMHRLQKQKAFDLYAFHVNFGLRGKDSDRDEKFVRKFCEERAIPLFVKSLSKMKALSQEETRRIRLEAAKVLVPQAVLLEAHHADDQLETFLFRLARGSGLSGLVSMRSFIRRENRVVVRPFLKVTRAQIEEFADREGLKYRTDKSNAKDVYTRNWIRNKLLPKLLKKFPQFKVSVLRLLDQIQAEDDFFATEVQKLREELLLSDGSLDVLRMRQLHPALLHRFLHDFIRESTGVAVDRERVLDLERRLRSGEAFAWNAPKDWLFKKASKGGLRIVKAPGRPLERKKPATQ